MRSETRRKVTDEEVIKILEGKDKWHEKSKVIGTIISEEKIQMMKE